MLISIHVPSWGTTGLLYAIMNDPYISIHVPSWGTTAEAVKGAWEGVFQSTFPRGERQSESDAYPKLITFQSTFPRGERRKHNSGKHRS